MKVARRLLCLSLCLACTATVISQDTKPTKPKQKFPTGPECAKLMKVPEGFVVKCFAHEPDVVNPIAIDFDSRGRVWVLECLQYPQKARGDKGKDRIRIYEDTDGDGVADKVTTFAEGLNLATGMALGHGGVFVGEAPNLVFLEDTTGGDKANKKTVLLDGWGFQDTHETLNSFIWGPDGWLYGCHGVFTHSYVGKPGTPRNQRVYVTAGIWRYHPRTQKFEYFSEGTSNPWGFDYDENGSGFLACCVIPHLFHMAPGGLYARQAGQNRNPYAYGEMKWICEDLHYHGVTPHSGNRDPKSLDKGGGHAHAGCLIYQGGAYPEKWNGRVFMNNIHGSRINTDVLRKNGSSYIGNYGGDILVANDPNNRIVQLRTGPDGSIYMIDWYDPQFCHDTNPALWDREHGRIYKLEYHGNGGPKKIPPFDLNKMVKKDKNLVELLKHENSWWWRKALLILAERANKPGSANKQDSEALHDRIESMVDQKMLENMVLRNNNPQHQLRALWALACINKFREDFGQHLLTHNQPWIRVWTVRLLSQLDEPLSDATWRKLIEIAKTDPSPDVRLHLAAACQRFRKFRDPKDILFALLQRTEDAKDPAIPFMIWVALEPSVVQQAQVEVLDFLAKHADEPMVQEAILPRTTRRMVATGDPKQLEMALAFAQKLNKAPTRIAALDGILEGLRGQRLEAPALWKSGKLNLADIRDSALILRLHKLGIHFGDVGAVNESTKIALHPKIPLAMRRSAVQDLALARLPVAIEPLLQLAAGQEKSADNGDGVPDQRTSYPDASLLSPAEQEQLQVEALRALSNFDQAEVPARILKQWPYLSPTLRKETVLLLTGRKPWALALMQAVQAKQVAKTELTENDIRRVLALRDKELTKAVEEAWGKLREGSPEKVEKALVQFRQLLAEQPGDRKAGRAVFEKNCMVCHKLRGEGHEVGPDLTGANRRDAEYLLVNILDPNRVVGKDYYTAVVLDKSGRLHTGIIAENTPQRVSLKGENAKLETIPRSEIEEMKLEEKSLMPEGLPDNMTPTQFRDLIAYLMEDPYLNRGLIAGPFKTALDAPLPIEQAPHPLQTTGVTWRPFQVGQTGMIDMKKLNALAPPTDSTAYVYFEVTSPKNLRTGLELAADENVKVWLNGQEIHRRMRSTQPRRVEVDLKQGTNWLLFKVHDVYPPSWLWARLGDPERILELRQPSSESKP
jgi:putative membrane-bound dehydrogenase-like protein